MRKIVCRSALFAIVALVLPLAFSSVASAQMREFTGKVDNTEVTGEKTEWDAIKKDDWVTVSWKMIDKPRKAYVVHVLPPREEAGEEE